MIYFNTPRSLISSAFTLVAVEDVRELRRLGGLANALTQTFHVNAHSTHRCYFGGDCD